MSNENNSMFSFLPNFNLDECKKLINTNMARGCGSFEFEQPINITQLNLLYDNFDNNILFFTNVDEPIKNIVWMKP